MISEKAKRYYRLGVRAKDLRIFTDKTTIMNNGYSTWVIEDTKTNRLIGRGNIYSCTKFKGELKRVAP